MQHHLIFLLISKPKFGHHDIKVIKKKITYKLIAILTSVFVDIDECATSPCQNGGSCNDQINGYTCNCTSQYFGTNCEYGNNDDSH